MNKPNPTLNIIAFSMLFSLFQGLSFASDPNVSLDHTFIIDCKTNQSYGLNSYYLFLHQPVFKAHTNALKQTELLLRKIVKVKQLYPDSAYVNQQTLLIPVSFEPQSWILQPEEADYEAAARWVLHNYDYQCAKSLLKPFPRLVDNGPYILSSAKMLLPNNLNLHAASKNPVLVQNFSEIEPDKSLYWLEIFFKKSWQPRLWLNTNLLRLHENLLESLLHYEARLNEENNPQKARLILAEDLPPGFVVLEEENKTIPEINPSKGYPVNEVESFEPNPYSDKITIEYSEFINNQTDANH